MYVTSQETADMIMSDCRTFRARIELADGTVINGSQITKIEPSYQSSQEDIAPGMVISQGFTATLTKDCGDLTGKTCRLYFYLIDTASQFVYDRKKHGDLIEYTHSKLGYFTHAEIARIGAQSSDLIPMGRYTITSCKRQGERISVEAHDGLYNIDELYVPSVNFPTTVAEIEIDICNKLRIGIPEKRCYIAVPGAVEGATLRDMLSWCASLDNGSFAVLDRMGVLVHKWYTPSSYTISISRADEPEAEKADITYTQLHCITEKDDLYSGKAGRCMTFTNPYMTQERLDGIALGIIGFSYRPLTVYHRLGDPRLDIWDIISVENADGEVYNCPVTGIVYSFDGGLSANIDVYGKTDGDTGSNSGPVTRSLKQMIANAKNETQMVMQESIDYINGAKGGYVITQFNADGQPIATLYTDNLDPKFANNVIKINQNGILGTNNGREGVYKTAITNDGRINASQILTGILSAIVVQSTNYSATANTGSRIDLNDGSFSFGGGRLTFNGSALSVRGRIVSDDTYSRAVLDDSYLEFYEKSGSTTERTSRLDDGGHKFYRDGEFLGFIGTNKTNETNKKGIVFDLDMSGDFMSWGAKESDDGLYLHKLSWFRGSGFRVGDDIEVGGDKFAMGNSDFNADMYRSIDMHGWSIYNAVISDTSDIRLKENVAPCSVDALDRINAVEVVSYDMADGSGHKDIGFIAQSLYEIDPALAGNGVKDGMEIMTVKPLELIPYLVKAVQQLSNLVTEQRAQIDDLYKQLKLSKKAYKNKKTTVDMNKYNYFKKIAAKGDNYIDKDKKLRS